MSKKASLRVCASCEWIFIRTADTDNCGCPKCQFGDYGARAVYGDKAYSYAKTQKPWFDKKMAIYAEELNAQISKANRPRNNSF